MTKKPKKTKKTEENPFEQAQRAAETVTTQLVDADEAKKGFAMSALTDVQVSTGDIVDIVGAEFERRVNREIKTGQKAVKDQEAVVKSAQEDLEAAAKKFAEVTGKKNKDAAKKFYESAYGKFDSEQEHEVQRQSKDVERRGVRVSYKVFSEKKKGRYYSNNYDYSHSLEFQEFYTFEEAKLTDVEQALTNAEGHLATLTETQLSWRRKLAELHSVERQTRAKLAAATLNQSEGGQALYNAITESFDEDFLSDMTTFDGLLGHKE